MKKKVIALTMVLLMVFTMFALTGCGNESEFADVQEKGTLVVGLDDAFAPMGFRDADGNLVGFDIDLANAVGEELGVEVEFVPIDWNAKEMELEAQTIDCVWNGMSITPDRLENMELTDKYLNNKIVLMSLASSDLDVTEASQLADLQIGTQVDSSALKMLQSNEAYESFKGRCDRRRPGAGRIHQQQPGRRDERMYIFPGRRLLCHRLRQGQYSPPRPAQRYYRETGQRRNRCPDQRKMVRTGYSGI